MWLLQSWMEADDTSSDSDVLIHSFHFWKTTGVLLSKPNGLLEAYVDRRGQYTGNCQHHKQG